MEKFLLIPVLLFIFFQDLKFRAVYWFLFPIVLGISIWIGWTTSNAENMLWSFFFFIFSMGGLTLYLSIKEGRLINISKGYFGLGDILFLIVIIPIFPFYMYLVFFTLGTIMSLLIHGIVLSIAKGNKTIPYAGYMSLFLIPYLVFNQAINQFILYYI